MLDNLASYLNSTSNKSLCYTSSQTKSEELLNQLSIANILQKYSKKNKWTVKSLVMYRSTPNLADLSENLPYDKINMLYKNKSTQCLTNAADHLENFLFNAYQRSSIVEGSSMENEVLRNYSYSDFKKLEDVYKFLNSENTHVVTIKKNDRGFGFSISGGKDSSKSDLFSQLIRVSKLYPLQPAMASENLFVGDIILEVNGTNMIGLTNTEALEFLRSSDCDVTFKVFRPTEYGFPSLSLCKEFWPIVLSSSFPEDVNGKTSESEKNFEEFEIVLIKQDGALGFTISKHEEKNYDFKGFYVHDLVREPAISDGRIHPGDFISKVNGVCISSFTHEEALSLLRSCPVIVTLTLIRPNPPVSPLSLDGEIPLGKPLRWEAIELLNDRMKLKDNGDSTLGKRKFKRKFNNKSAKLEETVVQQECLFEDEYKKENADVLDADFISAKSSEVGRTDSVISDQNTSAAEIINERLEQEYSSFDGGDREKIDGDSMYAKFFKEESTDEDREKKLEVFQSSTTIQDGLRDLICASILEEKCEVIPVVSSFEIVLNRGWHTRLGFSLQDPQDEKNGCNCNTALPLCPEVKAVYPGSLAAKDGRIWAKDRLFEVNSESLLGIPAKQVIGQLRKKTGRIRMVFKRLVAYDFVPKGNS